MKLVIKRNELLSILTSLIQIIPTKSSEVLFFDFLIKCEKEKLTIIASDGLISMKIEQGLKNEQGEEVILSIDNGKILTPAKILFDIINKCEGDIISLTLVDSNYLHISDEKSEFKVVVKPGEEYPDINLTVEENNQSIKVKIEDLKKLYEKTNFSVATKGPRELFYGININYSNDRVSFLSTDTYRMAKYTVHGIGEKDINFTCPIKALTLIKDIEEKGDCTIYKDNKSALFVTKKGILATRLLIGDFPGVEGIIPEETPYVVKIKSEEFVKIAERMSILSDFEKKNAQIKLTIDEERKVTLSANSIDYGNSNETVKDAKVEIPQNEKIFEIGFNIDFVLPAVKAQESEFVSLCFSSPTKVFLVKSEDKNNIQIITPVRLNNY